VKTFLYPALIEFGEEEGLVVTFPDVPEAITQGEDQGDALAQASDALGLALLAYCKQGRALPQPSPVGATHAGVSVAPDVAAKLAVIEAFRAAGLTKSDLARRLGRDEKEVRRILDPMHATKLPALQAALAALGRRFVIAVEEIPVDAAA
jgi:antitoxin HicB